MGIVQVTTRPSYYAALEAEAEKNAPEPEIVLTGKISVKLEVCGMKSRNASQMQKSIEKVVSGALKEKSRYIREYNCFDDRGYYTWDKLLLHKNVIYTEAFQINEIACLESLMAALDKEGWYPEEIVLTYYPDGGDISTVYNLVTILESRRPLIEQSLSLREPMEIIVSHGLALSLSLSAFSYVVIEAAASYLSETFYNQKAPSEEGAHLSDYQNFYRF